MNKPNVQMKLPTAQSLEAAQDTEQTQSVFPRAAQVIDPSSALLNSGHHLYCRG